MQLITDHLVTQAAEQPEAVAIHFEDSSVTWKQLADQVALYAANLTELVPGRQEPIGLLFPNSLDFIIVHLAILYLQHISVPFDPTLKPLEIEALREGLNPKLILTPDDLPWLQHKREHSPLAIIDGDPETLAATLLFTSGTTGKPKATLYSHANHLWNVKTLAPMWQWTKKDHLLLSLPLSHWHGLVMGLTGTIYTGCTMHLERQFNAERTLELLSSGEISLFMHVPPAYIKLVNHPDAANYDFSKLRLCVSGSSYLPPAVWDKFYEMYGIKILERYGSSEAGIIASNLLEHRMSGTVGKLLPEVELKMLPNDELGIKSPGVFMAYFRNESATKAKFTEDGYLKTGDLGVIENGYIRLKGRIQERMKKSGYTVSPRDVEWALNRLPGVIDSYVLGIQGDSPDDEIVYFIQGSAELTEQMVKAFCKEEMPFYWRPDRIIFVPEIPKSKSGKPRIGLLRELADKK